MNKKEQLKYGVYYQEFSNEVHKALGCYLMWETFRRRLSEDNELLIALNRTPLSWILTRHALQVTLFMTLGRIFDINSDALSVDDLLKACIDEVAIFSKDSLRERRIRESGGKIPEYLDKYIQESDVIEAKHFHALRAQVKARRRIFEKNYRPIRHKLFAHSDKSVLGNADELWKNTSVKEIEGLIWFLNDMKEAIFNAYNNGRTPILTGRQPDCAFYERDFNGLLDRVKGAEGI